MAGAAQVPWRTSHAPRTQTRIRASDNRPVSATKGGLSLAEAAGTSFKAKTSHLDLTRSIARHRPVKESDDQLTTADVGPLMVQILPRLRRFAHSLTHDQDLSEDLVQETCARALAHLDQYRPNTRLDSWMYRIAQNLWIDQLRAQSVRGETVSIAAVCNLPGSDGRVVTESRLSLLELKQCIAELPVNQKALLYLVCVDGLSYKEAAETLDWSIGTVMSRLARVRVALHTATTGQPARSADGLEMI
jgi:RNA polymerase sigma-70 factor, ECF subfamily